MTAFLVNPADMLGETVTVAPVHLSSVYLHWWHGVQVTAEDITDEELRDTHDTRFPITGGLHTGYPLGGRG